jgi:hypothetical protein
MPKEFLYSLGDFLFHSHAHERPARFRRTYPPYNPSVLRSSLSRFSCVVRLHLINAGVRAVEIVPVMLSDLAEPEVVAGGSAEEILSMIDAESHLLGCRVK